MPATAIELQVAEFIENHREKTDEKGGRLVVRNGHMPERELVTGFSLLAPRYEPEQQSSLFPVGEDVQGPDEHGGSD